MCVLAFRLRLTLPLVSIGHGENPESYHPSFPCVLLLPFPCAPETPEFFLFFFANENDWGRSVGPSSVGVLCVVFLFLGLDGIDHLGLGGALRGARTVFRSGIHTWYHCRYVSSSLVSLSYFHLCCYRAVIVVLLFFFSSSSRCFQFSNLFFFFLGFRELYRVWIICTHIRHYGSTSRSKSCSTVTRDMRVVRLHRRVSHPQTIIVPPWPRS